jgi:hypothetical protein
MKKILLVISVMASVAWADFFVKGNTGVGITVGSGSVQSGRQTKNYLIAGLNGEYFVLDRLSVGLGYVGWFGEEPRYDQVTFPVTYYYNVSRGYSIYGGVFGRYTMVSDVYDDYSSYGVRGGITYSISKKGYVGIGLVQEYYDECSWRKECSQTSPEFIFAFMF